MSTILVTGSKAGLGLKIARVLRFNNHVVIDYDIKDGHDVLLPNIALCPDILGLDVLINCAGVNRINWLADVTESEFDYVMNTNAKGIYMMSRAFLTPLIKSKGTILNIISNASHMPMRCSLAYNASKAAAHIMTKQLARELAPNITVFGIAPNRIAGTEMSKSIDRQVVETRGWSLEETKRYQRAALLTGEETPPRCVAEFIGYLLNQKSNHKYLTGCVLPYGA